MRRQQHHARSRLFSRAQGEDGAAAVEFALVVPILGMLLLGIVTFGLAYSDHVALTNAVREGARLGATAPADSDWGSSVVDATKTAYANGDESKLDGKICALLLDSSNAIKQSSGPDCEDGNDIPAGPVPDAPSSPDGCYIKVWAELPSDLNWLLFSTTVEQHANSVSLYIRADTC